MLKNNFVSKYIRPLVPYPTSLQPRGQLQEKITCVLFDVYGTLFISGSGDISIARQKSQEIDTLANLLQQFEINRTPQSILTDFFQAIDSEHQRRKAKGADFPEVEIDRIWMQILNTSDLNVVRDFAVAFELIVNPVYPMPNLKKTLAGCRASNLRLGIISNAQFFTPYLFHWFLDAEPQHLGFHPDLLFFSYKFGVAKPSLYMFQLAAEKLKKMGVPAQATLYVGNDMLNDIYPAREVGFQTALFAGDARSLRLRENTLKCKSLSADIVITDLVQLLDYI